MDRTVTLFCLNLPHGAAIELVDDPMKHLCEAAGLRMPAFDKTSPFPSANTPNGVVGIRFQFPERDLVSEVRYLEEELAKLNIERMQVEVELKESKERYHEQEIEHKNAIARLKEDAADREKQLTRNLNIMQIEKNATQKELDEVKGQKPEGVDPLVIDPFSLGLGAFAQQATWALKACIEDIDRRMDEAGKIGTALAQNRSELNERLDEMAQLPPEEELTPELRKKLADMEKDYNEVTRQSARFFHTNQPISSIEAAQASPYPRREKGEKRSTSPSKIRSVIEGLDKLEAAAVQLTANLRSMEEKLAKKDEELRDLRAENSRLEIQVRAVQ
ncbi:hypothetical protein ANO14919_046470 [Xylariales sp. No.14919]|nr:hypothetical protein ANO14919_046470 [Xylariales sp. No.14919]